MLINIILCIVCLICISIVALYRRQVREICRQLKFIETNDTNKIISTEEGWKEIVELTDHLNTILKRQRQLEIEYKTKDNQLKETITNISHDIRTPLTSLKGYFELLTECGDEGERSRYAQIIETRLNSLQEISEQLFTYVKLQNESYELVFEECNLNKLLYNTLFSFYDDFKKREMEPSIEIVEETCFVWANEAGLRRVIQNVIKNALDYGKERIVVEMLQDGKTVNILVKNQYNPEDDIDTERVFQRFYKADASRNHNSSGLGLSIAYELMKYMKGAITAYLEEDFFVIKLSFQLLQQASKGQVLSK